MHWVKKTAFGMCLMLFIFVALVFLEAGNINPFWSEFVTLGGLILLLSMGIFETNFVTM